MALFFSWRKELTAEADAGSLLDRGPRATMMASSSSRLGSSSPSSSSLALVVVVVVVVFPNAENWQGHARLKGRPRG
jgi:hypothetical protein